MFYFNRFKKYHFVGIGGAGMSALAEILLKQGLMVTGSDIKPNDYTERLIAKGADVYIGHHPDYVQAADLIVITAAVSMDNPEVVAARRLGIPIIKRAEMLSQMMRFSYGIGVAGTHGKTTTSAMITSVLEAGGKEPTAIIGGTIRQYHSNIRLGQNLYFIAEADEYDRSFLHMHPCMAVITNIEEEHMDVFSDRGDLVSTFIEFANRVPFFGKQLLSLDAPLVAESIHRFKGPKLTYGFSEHAQIMAVDARVTDTGTYFSVATKNQLLGKIELKTPGRHNIQNALAAVCAGLEVGVDFHDITVGLANFSGIERRLEIRAHIHDILIVDDYAHHPTEIMAGIRTLKEMYRRRLIAIFQPHLYSRTRQLTTEFASALQLANIAIVTAIYPAREQPIAGVTGEKIIDLMQNDGHPNAVYIHDKNQITAVLKNHLRAGDIIVTMGAGDVFTVADDLIQMLNSLSPN